MAQFKAIFFDQDGVIIDTERDGHRVSFNETFHEFGFDVDWGVDYYHELLQIAGGKERMKHHLHTQGFGKEVKPEDEDELIKAMHKRKTSMFIEMVESGKLPLRPGVHRFMKEAMDAGLILGICTTSNERAAHAVAYKILSDIQFAFVLAGDVVSKKKPDPEIYLLGLEKTGLKPDEVIVIEDSRNGVLAAKAAGMRVVATTNHYTEQEDLGDADIIVTCLGDQDGEKGILKKDGKDLNFDGVLHVDQLVKYFSK
jgi:HAD superfamily hydrolase (TIGR01509 family)